MPPSPSICDSRRPSEQPGAIPHRETSGGAARIASRAVPTSTPVLRLTLLTDPNALSDYEGAWQLLAESAVDKNVFYEPWYLASAFRWLGAGQQFRIALVEAEGSTGTCDLVGFFPFVRERRRGGWTEWRMWEHDYSYLTNPLIARGRESEVLDFVIKELSLHQGDACLIRSQLQAADGPLQQAWFEHQRRSPHAHFVCDAYARAIVRRPEDPELYFKDAIGGHHFRELMRMRRKLEQQGQLAYRRCEQQDQIPNWIDWFLDLESRGWKGREGTCIQADARHRGFFTEALLAGAARERVLLEGLFLNGDPIALKCELHSPPVGYSFKIAFDESFRKHSPGMQLELESLRRLSAQTTLDWIDSCAIPDHPMINRVWRERRLIQHVCLATGRRGSDLVLAARPLARTLNRHRKSLTKRIARWLRPAGSGETSST